MADRDSLGQEGAGAGVPAEPPEDEASTGPGGATAEREDRARPRDAARGPRVPCRTLPPPRAWPPVGHGSVSSSPFSRGIWVSGTFTAVVPTVHTLRGLPSGIH